MVELKNVSVTYASGVDALSNVSLKINDGDFTFVVGSSGAGKSTMIKLLLKEIDATNGSVIVNGYNLNKLRKKKIPKFRRTLGFVFQDFRLIPSMTVYENIAFVLRVIDAQPKYIKKRVPYVINLVGLHDKMNSYPDELSGGEKQRVAIARALVNDPQLIIADEPTGNIDPELSYEIVELLKIINEQGTTVLMVTHEHELVRHFGGRIININNGEIVYDEIITGKNDVIPIDYEDIPLEIEEYEEEEDTFDEYSDDIGSEFPTISIAEALLNEKRAEESAMEMADAILMPVESMSADDIISTIKDEMISQSNSPENSLEKAEALLEAEFGSENVEVFIEDSSDIPEEAEKAEETEAVSEGNTESLIKLASKQLTEESTLQKRLNALKAAEEAEDVLQQKIDALKAADKARAEALKETEAVVSETSESNSMQKKIEAIKAQKNSESDNQKSIDNTETPEKTDEKIAKKSDEITKTSEKTAESANPEKPKQPQNIKKNNFNSEHKRKYDNHKRASRKKKGGADK